VRFCLMAVPSTAIAFACFVNGVGDIVLQMPQNRKRVTLKGKELIESICFKSRYVML